MSASDFMRELADLMERHSMVLDSYPTDYGNDSRMCFSSSREDVPTIHLECWLSPGEARHQAELLAEREQDSY